MVIIFVSVINIIIIIFRVCIIGFINTISNNLIKIIIIIVINITQIVLFEDVIVHPRPLLAH
jgi:hypothetical protein